MKDTDAKVLDKLVAEYLNHLDHGRDIPPQQFIADHPRLLQPFLQAVSQHLRINDDCRATAEDETNVSDDTPRSVSPPNDSIRRVGRYRLIGTLGSGGMSIVYEAVQAGKSESVALKVLHAAAANDPAMRKRFQRESETIRSLSHPHIVPLRDFGTHEGAPFLAMQLIKGETVAQQIRRSQALATDLADADHNDTATTTVARSGNSLTSDWTMTEKALAIANIADALDHAHTRNIVHRDIKPSNLLIDSNRKVWLTDFGLASANDAQTVLTRTGQVIGTPHYMSPEQASASTDSNDPRTDIYSLGATLYEWITLQRPHQGDQFHVLLEIASGRLQPPSKVCSNVPASLEAVVLKAMSHAPADRYASAAEMANDLRRFSSGRPVHARRPGYADHAVRWLVTNPKTTIASAVGFAAVVVAVILSQSIASWRLSNLNAQLAKSTATLEHTNTQLADTNADLNQSQTELRRHLYVADMALAYRAYAQHDIRAVHRLLTRHIPRKTPQVTNPFDQRGFEWWLLKNLSPPPHVLPLAEHHGAANELALSPDGSEVFSVGSEGSVRHWDILSGRELHQWNIEGSLDAIAISPDGSKLLTGSNIPIGLNPVTLRDTSTGEVTVELHGHEYSVESAAFSPDGNWIATAGRYHQVLLHDTRGQLRGRLMTGSRNESLCFSGDSGQLVAVYREKIDGEDRQSLRTWTVPDLTPAKTCEFDLHPLTFALSGNGKRMIVADAAQWTVMRWRDAKPISNQDEIHGRIRCVAIDHEGDQIAAGCDNGLIYIWQLKNEETDGERPHPRVITASDQKITSLAFLEDDRILSSCEDGMVQVWALPAKEVQHPALGVSTRAITRRATDCNRLFLRGDHGGIERFDLSTLHREQIARVVPDEQYNLAVTPDETIIVAAAPDQLVVVSAADGSELHRIDAELGDTDCKKLCFIDNGRRLLALYNDRFRQYETTDWNMTDEIMLPNSSSHALAFSPNESEVLVVTEEVLLFYDAKTLQLRADYPRRFGTLSWASYAANGKIIALGHHDGTIELLNAVHAEPIGLLTAHRQTITGLWFIENDRTLISASRGSNIRFWDVGSRREIGVLDIGNTSCDLIHFSRPLQKLFTFGPHAPIKVWSGQRSR
ncbi:serine/threonine-protein kinase [Novipirellula maiorica]|nr:serine/threonine-protein kinase [Rhodopirellula maiorica]